MAGDNEISLVTFGDRPTIVVDATRDLPALERGIGRLFAQPNAGSYFLDAVIDTARGFQKRESARPVIVAVTTEGVEFSNRHYDHVLDALKASGASLHVLVITTVGGSGWATRSARTARWCSIAGRARRAAGARTC